MLQTLPNTITFDEFLEWKPEVGNYELHEGVIFKMQPLGDHEEDILVIPNNQLFLFTI